MWRHRCCRVRGNTFATLFWRCGSFLSDLLIRPLSLWEDKASRREQWKNEQYSYSLLTTVSNKSRRVEFVTKAIRRNTFKQTLGHPHLADSLLPRQEFSATLLMTACDDISGCNKQTALCWVCTIEETSGGLFPLLSPNGISLPSNITMVRNEGSWTKRLPERLKTTCKIKETSNSCMEAAMLNKRDLVYGRLQRVPLCIFRLRRRR